MQHSGLIGAARRAAARGYAPTPRAFASAAGPAAPVVNERAVLYTNPASRGKIVEWYIAERDLGHRVEFQEMDMAAGEHKEPKFLSVNPFGALPAMTVTDDEGRELYHLFESGALLLALAEIVQETNTTAKRAVASQWVLFANSTLGNALFVESIREKQLPGVLSTLDTLLQTREYLNGDAFSVCDVAVGAYLLYVPLFFPNLSFAEYPAVCAYMCRLRERAAYQATLGARIAGASASAPPPSRMPAGGDDQAAGTTA